MDFSVAPYVIAFFLAIMLLGFYVDWKQAQPKRKFVDEWVQEGWDEERHMVTHDLGLYVSVNFYVYPTREEMVIPDKDRLHRMSPMTMALHKDYITATGFEPGRRYVCVVLG